ncbi:MAG: uL14 family ribosomal protein [Candidatus Woesearchaeota archaeon]
MKAIKRNGSRGIPIGARVQVIDNSGAKELRVISVQGYKTVKRMLECAGVGDMVTAHVTKGRPDIKHTVVKAVIVRQKQQYRRLDGMVVSFESNAAVILKDNKGAPKGTVVKGVVGKEVAERFPQVARIASVIA